MKTIIRKILLLGLIFFPALNVPIFAQEILSIPSVAEGVHNNYFTEGTGDGATLTTYNTFLRLHNGLAIGSPFTSDGSGGYEEKATIIFNGRNGKISTRGSLSAKGSLTVDGDVGIGTTTPDAALDVTRAKASTSGSLIVARLGGAYNHWTYFGPGSSGRIRGSNEGYLWIESNPNGPGDKRLYLNPQTPGDVTIANGGGNVLIGKLSQQNTSYKLDVAGKVRANEIVVNTTGADFVFEPDYELPQLEFVEQFIKENKHLPDIPAASVMQQEGMSVGELNTKLLQKVEELTLYLIQQNKKIAALENEIKQMKQK